jgi:hypothetical protein
MIPKRGFDDYEQYLNLYIIREKEAVNAYNSLVKMYDDHQIDPVSLSGRLHDECLSKWIEVQEFSADITPPENETLKARFNHLKEVNELWIKSLNKMIAGMKVNDESLIMESLDIRNKIEQKFLGMKSKIPGR